MPTLDVFNSAAFSTRSLTDAIQIVPNKYGRLQELGLFVTRSSRTRLIQIERKTKTLKVLPTVTWGAPATKGGPSTRELIPLSIPHIPVEDLIPAADVQGVRAFGSETDLESVQDLVNEKLMALGDLMDITLEYMRWGALRGTVLDGAGATVLDIETAFDITRGSASWALGTDGTQVGNLITTMKRYFDTNAKGLVYKGVHVFCSSGFFDAFIIHPKVKEIYTSYINNGRATGEDYRNRFEAWGVVFEEHNGTATDMAGSTVNFVPANQAIAIPIGTDIFQTHYAPADFIETVNTPGLPRYAKQAIDPEFQRWVKIHAQSNPLCLCTRADLIYAITKT